MLHSRIRLGRPGCLDCLFIKIALGQVDMVRIANIFKKKMKTRENVKAATM